VNQDYKNNTGIELDMLSFVSKRKAPVKKIKSGAPDTHPNPVKTFSADSNRNLSKIKLLVFGSSILLLLLAVIMLPNKGKMDISIPFFGSKNKSKLDTYVSIGPLISSMDSGDVIRITMDINCAKKSYRKQIADLDTEIRNQIIWSLQKPEAEKFMAEGDYYSLRSFIGNSVMGVIPKGMASEIYMSELLRY
jgi:hypothetical protein